MDYVNRDMRAIGTTRVEVHDTTGWRRIVYVVEVPQLSGSDQKKKKKKHYSYSSSSSSSSSSPIMPRSGGVVYTVYTTSESEITFS